MASRFTNVTGIGGPVAGFTFCRRVAAAAAGRTARPTSATAPSTDQRRTRSRGRYVDGAWDSSPRGRRPHSRPTLIVGESPAIRESTRTPRMSERGHRTERTARCADGAQRREQPSERPRSTRTRSLRRDPSERARPYGRSGGGRNRTHRTRITRPTRFEDEGSHQAPFTSGVGLSRRVGRIVLGRLVGRVVAGLRRPLRRGSLGDAHAARPSVMARYSSTIPISTTMMLVRLPGLNTANRPTTSNAAARHQCAGACSLLRLRQPRRQHTRRDDSRPSRPRARRLPTRPGCTSSRRARCRPAPWRRSPGSHAHRGDGAATGGHGHRRRHRLLRHLVTDPRAAALAGVHCGGPAAVAVDPPGEQRDDQPHDGEDDPLEDQPARDHSVRRLRRVAVRVFGDQRPGDRPAQRHGDEREPEHAERHPTGEREGTPPPRRQRDPAGEEEHAPRS